MAYLVLNLGYSSLAADGDGDRLSAMLAIAELLRGIGHQLLSSGCMAE